MDWRALRLLARSKDLRGAAKLLPRRAGLSSRTALLPGARRCAWVVGRA